MGTRHKKEVDPKKKTLFVMEKYIEDAKQDERHVPDLLEVIMRSPGLVKEELRRISFKMYNLDTKSLKLHFCDVRKNPGFGQRSQQANHFNPVTHPFCNIWPR